MSSICFACSQAAKTAFEYISDKLNKIENLKVFISPVKSTYWGDKITVAGLITSEDLINTVKNVNADYILIPGIMLKPYTELFLDGKSLDYVKTITGKNFYVIKNNYSLKEAVDLILQYLQ